MANEFIIKNGFISKGDGEIDGSLYSTGSSATGTTSLSYGFQNNANGSYSISLGYQNNSNGNASVSLGSRNTASGNFSVAEGSDTTASGLGSHSEGNNTIASGVGSHAEGETTTASGDYSHAEGRNTVASGSYSHAQNRGCQAIGGISFAGGETSVAIGSTSFIYSTNSLVTGDRSVVLGGQNITGTTNDTVYVPNFVTNGIVQKLGVITLPAGSTLIPEFSSIVKVQNNGTAVTATLSNGTSGQRLTIYVLSAGSPATGTTDIQPTTSAGFTSAIIGSVGDSIDLIYDDTVGWVITGSYGATIS